MVNRRLVHRLVLLLLLSLTGAYAPAVLANVNPCAGNSSACRDAGFKGCCDGVCSCSDADPSVCTCSCC